MTAFDPDFAQWFEWAQAYRVHGLWQVVPCWLPSERKPGESWKRPKLSEWARYRDDRIDDVVFNKWYGPGGEHVLRQNMGCLTGKGAGNLLVVDLDLYKGAVVPAWWDELIESENNGIPIETIEQITGGGGRQMFFRWPEGRHAPTNRTPRGIDIRGDGGFVVLPPSMHESGKPYAWAPGRAPWETSLLDAPEWLVEAVESLVEAFGGHQGQAGPQQRTASPGQDYTPFGSRQDGRETEMFRAVWRAVLELYRAAPIKPGPTEELKASNQAYQAYEDRVVSRVPGDKRAGLDAEGRGPKAWAQKWRREMRNWGSPKMQREAAKPDPGGDSGHDYAKDFDSTAAGAEQQAKADPGKLFEFLDADAIKAMPDPVWAIDKLMIERSLGFIYGPPGSLKTFIGLDIALSMTTKRPTWWGYQINKTGAVVYICAEGHASLKYRIAAWEQNRGADASGAPFYLIRQSINFMDPNDVGVLLATVQAIADKAGQPISAVFVDTVSKVLPGSDENLQKDMSIFVRACSAVLERFGSVVVGIHHTNKGGEVMRGSTVLPAAGDFIIRTEHRNGAKTGVITIDKIKDGEDGWARSFDVKRIELAMGRSSLVVDGTDKDPDAADLDARGWPAKEVLREILAELSKAFYAKQPWGRSSNHARPAARIITRRWGVKQKVAKDILEAWLDNGIIEEADADAKKHIRGYRKVTDI